MIGDPSVDWVAQWAKYSPNRIAFSEAETQRDFTFSEVHHICSQMARVLRDKFGVRTGDRVAVLLSTRVEFAFFLPALQKIGAVLVPINFRLTGREVQHIVGDSKPKLIIFEKTYQETVNSVNGHRGVSFEDEFERLFELGGKGLDQKDTGESAESAPKQPEQNPWSLFESPCMILYTSGTTGAPKGAVLTNRALFWNSMNTTLRLNLSQEDTTISFLPFFHTGGWNVLTTPLLHRGARTIFMRKFDPDLALNICHQQKVTILFGVPTTMALMRESKAFDQVDLSSVRYAIVGGEPMPIPLIQAWQEKGIPIRQGYGLTEFGPNVFSLNEEDSIRKIGSIGFPNFYIQAKIVDDHNKEVGADTVGELILSGPMCMSEYFQNPKGTQDTIKDGWLWTGDLVRRDSEGFFYVVGRKKEMFISGGENVYPAEVEKVLLEIPEIKEVAVIGVPDPKWGEVGKAFIAFHNETNETVDEAHIQKHCLERLAKFKVPKSFEFMKELPKGDSGKILKRLLAHS